MNTSKQSRENSPQPSSRSHDIPRNESPRTPSRARLLKEFNSREYDYIRKPSPIWPFRPFKPSFKPLNLAQLPSFEDEVSTEELRYIVNRLDEANRPQRVPNLDNNEEAAEHQVPENQEDDNSASDAGSRFEQVSFHSSAPNESRRPEMEPEPSSDRIALKRKHSEDGITESFPKRLRIWRPSWEGAVTVERELMMQEETVEIFTKEEPVLGLIENNEKTEGAIVTVPQETQEGAAMTEDIGEGPPAALEQSADDETEEGNRDNDGPRAPRTRQRRRRGVKRDSSEVETGYWLRSRKPPSSSKRSRKTRYWLRP